jgi:DNA polymerase-3 subunit delta'
MMAPWIERQLSQLLQRQGHAWLLQGPSGLGQFELGLALAKAWLCEQPTPQGACGTCSSCHAVEVHTHADMHALLPETLMVDLGWPLHEKAQKELDEKKRKPSKEIRIDAMRDAVEFAQRTDARGRGKVVVVYPAERMNHVTANALLKTLEEPAGKLRFVLASEAAHQLLPTIRSRCQVHTMAWPDTTEALAWLQAQGLAAPDAQAALHLAGGRPEDALVAAQTGEGTRGRADWPKALARGDYTSVPDWTPAGTLVALQKLCHDLHAVAVGAAPRFFDAEQLPRPPSLAALSAWGKALRRQTLTVEHPFNPGLLREAVLDEGHRVLRLL